MKIGNIIIPSGCKPTPLGIIPEDWEVTRIGDWGKVITGSTPPTEDEANYGETYKFVSPADISESKYIQDTEKHLSEKGFALSRPMPKGTVLFTCIGSTIGKCAIADEELTSNQQINAIICDNEHNHDYLYYELCHNSNKIRQLAGEQAVPIINKTTFESFKMLCPPIKEQNKIASILSIWDIAIDKQTALIEQLTLRKCGLLQQLLTGRKRLKGFEEEWKTIEVGDALSYIQPTKYLVCNENYNDSYDTPVLTAGKTFILGYTNEKTGIFDDLPAIIFDDFTTESKYVTFPFKAKSSAMKILKAENSNLYYMFCIMQIIKYSIGGHERNWISKYSHLTIKAPSIEEQNAIASILVNADKEIEIQKQKLAAMQEQKKGLMQVLLTGKRRVK